MGGTIISSFEERVAMSPFSGLGYAPRFKVNVSTGVDEIIG